MKLRVVLIALFVLLVCQFVSANELPVNVKLNDDYYADDTAVQELEGRLFVPLRPFAEAFGGVLEWNPEQGVTWVYAGDQTYVFGPNVNKQKTESGDLPLETQAYYNEGTLLVELRAFVSLFEAQIAYDKDAHTIQIIREGAKLPDAYIGKAPEKMTYTEKDVITLARLVHIESQGGSLFRSLAVANVVVNRVKSSKFPNSINAVVYQHGQFPPTRRASFNDIQPTPNALRAAKLALEGYNNIGNCLYFNHRPFSWKNKSDLFKYFEGMYFYL